MKSGTSKKMSREEREMQRLMKKLRKGKENANADESPRYVDPTAARDYRIEDIEADRLFREMKRRDF